MSFHRAAVLALVVSLGSSQAFAQDDLLVPLPNPSSKSKSKAAKHRAAAAKPKKGVAKKPEAAPSDDDLVVPMPAPTQKPATAKKPEAAPSDDDLIVPMPAPSKKPATAKKPEPTPSDDDLIVPIGGKGQLLVKVPAGMKGARLLVDNKDMAALPMTAPLQLDAGEHTVIVRRPGFNDFTRRVTTQSGKPVELAATLEAVAGVVAVTADVADADVTVNGQPRGKAPLNNLVLKPGSYDIVVSKQGFQPETKNIAVRAGKDYTVAVSLRPAETTAVASADAPKQPNLTPPAPAVTQNPTIPLTQPEPEVAQSPPLYKRWYVWVGAGVVAAAATGVLVATQSGGTRPLDANKDVCGGTCDGTINAPGSGIVKFGVR
jgi:PEGA domain-containing protein